MKIQLELEEVDKDAMFVYQTIASHDSDEKCIQFDHLIPQGYRVTVDDRSFTFNVQHVVNGLVKALEQESGEA